MLKFQSFSPDKNSTGVSQTTPVYFEIRNLQTTAVKNTINVKINGIDALINGVFQTGFSGAINNNVHGYDVYVQHVVVFTHGQIINVWLSVNDNNGYAFIDSYHFTVIINDTVAPSTIANPKGGTYASHQLVRLIVSKPSSIIYYTIDGLMPTTSSTVYFSPIVIAQNTTLKFFSIDSDGNRDYVHVEVYQLDASVDDHVVPVTTASIISGTYYDPISITLSCSEPATIYWTTDGSIPTLTNYAGKDSSGTIIKVTSNSTLKFFAIDEFGNQESVKEETYVISSKENNIVPTNVFVNFPYIKNTVDISWDDMMPMQSEIMGYNVYRSQVDAQYLENIVSHDVLTTDNVYSKEDGTFVKINTDLVTTTFYRDQYLNRVILKEDVSDQFRFSTLIDVNTDFSGQIVNSDQWNAIDPDRLFNQSDGINFIDGYGNNRGAYFQSAFILSGDFDIQTAYKLYDWPITDSIDHSECAFIVSYNQYSYVKVSRVRYEATDYIISEAFVDSTRIGIVRILISGGEGSIRIVRSGPTNSDISTYYYDGSTWVLLDSYIDFTRNDIQVKFYAKSSNVGINIKFLYFQATTANAKLPLIKDVRGNYSIQVRHTPIATSRTEKLYTDQLFDVEVFIDGKKAAIKSVDGLKGVIILDTERQYDQTLQTWYEPPLPSVQSLVTVTYQYNVNSIKMNLSKLPFYKVVAVLSDNSETRLEWCPSITLQSDKLDYMYLEAIRRNSWLLDQAGERVLLFIRKTTGEKCKCYKRNERTHGQPQVGSCKICWGTGFVGGYEGPYEIRISPFQSEQRISMQERGMKLENIESTWTSISPIITQRDFIARRNSQMYAIGPISTPQVRGIATQQHFSVEHIDSTDIRYEFVASLNLFNYQRQVGLRKPFAHYTDDQVIIDGEVTENDKIRTDKGVDFDSKKGRTITFENSLF